MWLLICKQMNVYQVSWNGHKKQTIKNQLIPGEEKQVTFGRDKLTMDEQLILNCLDGLWSSEAVYQQRSG